MRRSVMLLLTVGVLAAGCANGDGTGEPAADEPATETSPTTGPTSPADATDSAGSDGGSPTATAAPADTTTPDPGGTGAGSPEPAPTVELVAEPGGLRAVTLGEPLATATATLRRRLGAPDADTGWEPAANSSFGVCPGATDEARVRGLRWGRIRLLFSDGPTSYGSDGYQHLFAYDLTSFTGSGETPTTAAGIGLGSTVEELRAAYGDRVELQPADEIQPARFTVRFGRSGQLNGSLTSTEPSGTATFLSAGLPCGE